MPKTTKKAEPSMAVTSSPVPEFKTPELEQAHNTIHDDPNGQGSFVAILARLIALENKVEEIVSTLTK